MNSNHTTPNTQFDSPTSVLSSPPSFSEHATFESPGRDTASEASPAKLMLPGDKMMTGDPPSPSPSAERPSKRICLRYDPVNFARKFAHMAATPAPARRTFATPGPSARSTRVAFSTPAPESRRARSTSQALLAPRSAPRAPSASGHLVSLMSAARDAQATPTASGTPVRPPSAGKMSLVSTDELSALRSNNNVLREQNLAFAQTNAGLTHRAQVLEDQITTTQAEVDRMSSSSPAAMATPASTTGMGSFSITAAQTPARHHTPFASQAAEMALGALEAELKQAKEELEQMTGERTLYWECCLEFARLEKLATTDLSLTKTHVAGLMGRITELEQEVSNATRAKQAKTLELSQLKARYQDQLVALQGHPGFSAMAGGIAVRDFGRVGGSGEGMGMGNGGTGGFAQSQYPDLGGNGMPM